MKKKYKNLDQNLLSQLGEKIAPNINKKIVAGEDYIPVTGKVLDQEDILCGVDSMIDAWLTTGVMQRI